jgi:hypothetical protein
MDNAPETLTCDEVTFNPNLVKLSSYHLPVRGWSNTRGARPVVAVAFVQVNDSVEVYSFCNYLEADTYRRVKDSSILSLLKASLEAKENAAEILFKELS